MASIEIAIFIALVVAALFYVYLAAFTSWHVAKSAYFDPSQKYAQYAIIWLAPILGAALVLHILSPDVRLHRPGWLPWFDYLLVSTFASSVSAELENAADHLGANEVESSGTDSSGHD